MIFGIGFWRALVTSVFLAVWQVSAQADTFERPDYVGVNLAGAEFGAGRIPGQLNTDYMYPSNDGIDYFLDRGMNTIRLPFLWERLQLNLGWPLEVKELERLDSVVDYITGRGAYVILDVHNYGYYFGKILGSAYLSLSDLADFWGALAEHYKDNERVIFGLMNEPNGIRSELWRDAVEAAIAEIRRTDARNLILVPGSAWSGAHSWTAAVKGKSNADVFRNLSDPADNIAFEVHQYFDSDYSGTSNTCQSETIGVEALHGFTRWLRENDYRGFLGEFGASDSEVCLKALDNVLQYIADNKDVWIGWTYWAAGAWWNDYPFSVEPSTTGDKPQMHTLLKYIDPNYQYETPVQGE